jgi:hypothetical protein
MWASNPTIRPFLLRAHSFNELLTAAMAPLVCHCAAGLLTGAGESGRLVINDGGACAALLSKSENGRPAHDLRSVETVPSNKSSLCGGS